MKIKIILVLPLLEEVEDSPHFVLPQRTNEGRCVPCCLLNGYHNLETEGRLKEVCPMLFI